MDLFSPLAAIVAVNLAAWITPGPNMLAVIAASLAGGRVQGIATGAGLAAAATLWALAAVLGVATMFELFPQVAVALKLAGAAYLVWLGARSLRTALRQGASMETARLAPASLLRAFRTGFLVSMTNPKAALFFGSVMTAFVPVAAPGWFLAAVVALCGVLAILLHAITATVFSTDVALRAFARGRRWISGLFGIAFLAMGAMVAHAALRRG